MIQKHILMVVFFADVNTYYDEICIGSGMWEIKLEADSEKEAIEIFKAQNW